MRRSRTALALPFAVVLAVGLAACTAAPEAAPSTPAAADIAASSSPSASVTPTASASATAGADASVSDAVVTLSLDGASSADGSTLTYSIDAVDAWTEALGSAPVSSPVEGPYGGTLAYTSLDWSGLKLTVPDDGSTNGARVFVSTPTVAGHPIVTTGGIGVGSTRAEALAAGAVEGFDATELRLDVRDVPGTTSLQRAGETGRQYVMLVLEGDSVAAMHLPADDFSDI